MAPIKTAIISFSLSKTCYISIPEYWKNTNNLQELTVFEIQYDENKKAFVSWRGETVPSKELRKDVIQISRHYGAKLGLKDGEEVILQQLEEFISSSKTVCLEPLGADDWEIMKLNAGVVEKDLLNQIQLVWKGLVFPVWVNKSLLFFVKVVEIDKDVQLAKLVQWTEVHIIPKERTADGTDETDSVFHPSTMHKKHTTHHRPKHFKRFRKRSISSPSFVSPVVQESESSKRNEVFEQSPSNNEDKKIENSSVLSIVRYLVKSVFTQSTEQSNTELSTLQEKTKYAPEDEYYIPFQINLKLRVIPFLKEANVENGIPYALQATTAFISARSLFSQNQINDIPSCFVARISKLLSPLERQEKLQKAISASNNTANSGSKSKKEKETTAKDKKEIFDSICIKVIIVHSYENEFDCPENIFLSENCIAVPRELQRRLGLEVSSIVHCENVQYNPVSLDSLQLIPLSKLPSSITEEFIRSAFVRWADKAINDASPLIISDGTLVRLPARGKNYDFVIGFSDIESPASSEQISPSSQHNSSLGSITSEKSYSAPFMSSLVPQYGYLNKALLDNITIKLCAHSLQLSKSIWCSNSTLHNDQALDLKLPALRLEALGGVKILSENGLEVLMFWLGLRPVASALSNGVASSGGRMLICGPKGVGKSTLAKALCRKLVDHPYYVFTKIVECRTLRGKRVETIAKKWESAYAEAVHRQPAVLFFDDLDLIASAPATPEQEAGPDGLYFSKVVQVFLCMLNNITSSDSKIVVMATAISSHTLHPSLTYTRGRHVFQTVLDALPPSLNQREEILKSLVLSKTHLSTETMESVLWSKQAARTEGYVAQDLDVLIDRATHAAWLRTDLCLHVGNNDGQVTLTDEDFEVALDRFTPASLRGLQLHISGNKTWKDVGGLHHVKKAVQEILLWPMKYHSLFAKCPLKPQSSILLYGAPGTGKTLLAGVVAKECGLNFISIKGPELLSKYIGASEQAVRDIFQRASSAKPCVLFFDEFDAIAPRRGHDSTGVTDRVVNQLLTQMDGVETLQGVYVLAATSRPELIDAALLRPGRLDKCLHCPLPDEAERLEILEALSRHLTLLSDVNMEDVVKVTEHFSGADLQALLYSSQLEALHEFQGLSSEKQPDTDEECFNSTIIANKLIYMPSVEVGKANPTSEEGQKLLQEINIIRDNVEGRNAAYNGTKHRKYSTWSIGIQQKHLMKVALQMKPSVSSDERQRYQEIYEKFVGSRGGDFSLSIDNSMKRVTLA